ncbi:hypothetical protein Tco_1342857, partial [Tanacetum coccineum]
MHIFVGSFTYVLDFLIVKNISSVIDPSLSQVVLRKPFVEVSNMTYGSSLGIVKYTNGTDEFAYMMPCKIEQFKYLSNMKKEHKQSVYFRSEEDNRRGVDYVMNKILGFNKECLDLEPEYLTGLDGSRTVDGVTLYLIRRVRKFFGFSHGRFLDEDLAGIILNGDSVTPVASASVGAKGPIPLKTAKHKLARKNELKAKSTLMLSIPDEHLLKFHACKDAKSLWEAIKNRFGGN